MMQIIQHIVQRDRLLLETTSGRIMLTPYSSKIIRIRYTLEAEFSTQESLMITGLPDSKIRFTVEDLQSHLLFSTAELTIRILKKTGAFTYLDAAGAVLTKEPDRRGKTLVPMDVMKSVFDESASIEAGQGADGLRVRADNVTKVRDRKAFHTKLEFEWMEDEALYGLGSHEEGVMNLRGTYQYLYQQNMKAVVPVLVSTRGYGIVVDSYSMMTFRDDTFGSYLWTEVDDEMDYYFIHGPEMDSIVHGVRQLTGKAPMLPKWSFGYIQSKERYTSQEELVAVVREYRERELPLDCIVLDWKSWTGELWGQKTLDPERFPDPKAMVEELHRMNARLMVSIWPIMNPQSDNNKEMNENGCLLGNQATYDAFQEKGRQLYWKQANEGLFAHGIDAWWCDCTEPFEADWHGSIKLEPEQRRQINTEEAKLYLDPEFINAYSLLHSRGIYEGQRRTTESKRVVNLTRSAYAGQHRYGTVTWSGDIAANWQTLRKQIPAGLNFCATGSPYWTVDIGAFFVQNKPELWFWNGEYNAGVQDMGYRELYARWFQYGSFLPMFRSHGTDTPREVWRFGEPGEPVYDSIVKFLRLRYELMPYLYALSAQVYLHDYTLMRALSFDFRHDPNTYNIGDQFMFGPAFLVNPVTEPMYYNAGSELLEGVKKTRNVYLPQGNEWYDFWTNRIYAGGQTIEAEAPLDRIPLYVKAGSIVPRGGSIQFAEERPNNNIHLCIYSGQNSSFVYYEDEGDNYNYERGVFALIPMVWDEEKRTFIIKERQGTYPGMSTNQSFNITFFGVKDVDGSLKEAEKKTQIHYTGNYIEIKLEDL
ncbi:TIM-barrel domain-containing protein [Paenibacillus sp. Soil766]|uniref:glycoside hydrolase family 31 protein n=1 Tax=Paenibacillus sp. Soil766 TaxID=1736404 RepID=UPI001F19AD1B|nr:TIM-barrel domain-containing protein [Paenibacillus sp. Soil766]